MPVTAMSPSKEMCSHIQYLHLGFATPEHSKGLEEVLSYPVLLPQIDGSTLRTLCLQHGPLITFHLNLTQGNAVVRYSSKEEAAKAQKSLHMYVFLSPSYCQVATSAQ